MKTKAIFIISLLILGANSQFLRFLHAPKDSYDYSSYSSTSTNENLTGKTLSSTKADQSVVYVTESGITITDSNLNKESGDSSMTHNSEFYGVNAAVLVNGGELTISGGKITTAAKGANAVVATRKGNVTITDTEINSTATGSARGLHSTHGGKIEATNVKISTTGKSCATLATDRGEGIVTCTECTLSTAGAGSPLIYSTGDITVSKTEGTATGAQAVVVEGKNVVTVKESSNLKCNGNPNRKNVDQCGVMLYQSMSGDAKNGTGIFNCDKSTIEIQDSSSVYSTAPMFFVTNTQAEINLEECTFKYGSGIFLKAEETFEWGKRGANGGVVTLTLTNQDIEGDFVVDANSGLIINLVGASIKGKINEANTAAKIEINLDKDSSIELTGNSFYSALVNEKTDGSNLVNGTYNWTSFTEKEIKTSSGKPKDNGPNRPPRGPPPTNMTDGMPPFNSSRPPHDHMPPFNSSRPPFNSSRPPHDGMPPFNSSRPPFNSSRPPHDHMPPFNSSRPPFNSSRPPHDHMPPFNSSRPPHDGMPPFNSSKPPHDGMHPFNSSNPPHEGMPPEMGRGQHPHEGMPPFNSSMPPFNSSRPPFNSSRPPHDGMPPFNSSRPPHDGMSPFNSSNPPSEGMPPQMPNGGQRGQGMPPDMPNGGQQPFNSSNPPSEGMPPQMPNGDQNGQPPNGAPNSGNNGMPNGQTPNGEPNQGNNGIPNGQPPQGSSNPGNNGIPNGQPPNGEPDQGNNGMPSGQPPNGEPNTGMPNGQPPNDSTGNNPNNQPPSDQGSGTPNNGSNGNANANGLPDDEEEELSYDDLQQYVKNNAKKVNTFTNLTLLLILAIIA